MTDPKEVLAKPEKTDEEVLTADRARHKQRVELSKARQAVKALEREVDGYRERVDFIESLAAAPDPEPYAIARRPGQGNRHQSATYVMLASDWHVEERVRPETVNNLNEYGPEIAQERARRFWKSNLILLNAARAAWDVRDAVLWIGGDIITGYIHEEYLEENFLSPTEASLLAFNMLASGIKTFLAESDVEHLLIPTSNGNHGRTTPKKRIATSARNSYEWMLYQMLAKHFEGEPRVTFQIASGYHNLVDCYGFRIRFHHGDAIGYGGGVGGLSIPVNRRIGRQAKGEPNPVHLDCFGHFHQRLYPGTFICNGSLIGWNAFAEQIGCGFEEPAQTSFIVDERYRVVSNYNAVIVQKSSRKG